MSVMRPKMKGYLYTPTKSNSKSDNKTAMFSIASTLNNTVNEWIMLFGDGDEDAHLFQGR